MHYRALLLVVMLLAATSRAGAEGCPAGNLLGEAVLGGGADVLYRERLTDGVTVPEGRGWDTTQSAVVMPGALAFDLGRPLRLRAVFLQGDHRGHYTLSGSLDGERWFTLWQSPPASGRGMRSRETAGLDRVARWVRLEAPGEHSAHALSEIGVYCAVPSPWPPTLTVDPGSFDPNLKVPYQKYARHVASHRMAVAFFGWLVFLGIAVSRTRPSAVARAAALALSAAGIAYLLFTGVRQEDAGERWLQVGGTLLAGMLPMLLMWSDLRSSGSPSPARAKARDAPALAVLIAGAGALVYSLAVAVLYRTQRPATALAVLGVALSVAVLVHVGLRARWTRRERSHRLALASLLIASAYALVHFGTVSHWGSVVSGMGAGAVRNAGTPGWFVLYHDQFHYFLGAKYFRELGYDKLYHCAAIAEMDNGRGDLIARQRVQDLNINRLMPGQQVLDNPGPCRAVFTPARWRDFRADVAYFRTRVNVRAAEVFLMDYGYNASPFWTAVSLPLVAGAAASDATMQALTGVDIGLLLCMFALAWWAFGLEVAVLGALLWGTTSIWMFEAQGGIGSFGRLYWVAAAVAAVCLLKKGWFALGGFSLSIALLDRVFPGAFLFGPAAVAAFNLLERRRDARLWRLLAGAVVGLALLSAYTLGAAGGVGAVRAFVANATKHVSSQPINNVGMPALIAASAETITGKVSGYRWSQLRHETLERRRGLFVGLAALALAGCAWVCRRAREPWKLVIAGLVPMYALFAVSSYYYAVLVVLAPLAAGRVLHTAVLIGMVLAGHVLYHNTWAELTFVLYSALLVPVLLFFLGVLAGTARRTGDAPHAVTAPGY